MKKVVLKLDLHDDKDKQKAMKIVSSLSGVDSIAMDMKERKVTVTGDVDPVNVVSKLRKSFRRTEIVTVGPATEPKQPEKKPQGDGGGQPKKDDQAKGKGDNQQQQGQPKKDADQAKKKDSSPSGGGGNSKEALPAKENPYANAMVNYNAYRNDYYPQPPMTTYYYVRPSAEEDPNSCVIS